MISPNTALQLWYVALDTEIGLAVRSDDKDFLKVLLYEVRKQSGDPRLAELLIMSPNGDELFICKKETNVDG